VVSVNASGAGAEALCSIASPEFVMPLFLFVNERNAPSTEAEPVVTAGPWIVVEGVGKNWHLALATSAGALRLTTPIRVIDRHARVVTTESGRKYVLGRDSATGETAFMLFARASAFMPAGVKNATEAMQSLLDGGVQ